MPPCFSGHYNAFRERRGGSISNSADIFEKGGMTTTCGDIHTLIDFIQKGGFHG
jgi:hypothetical protein